MRIKSSLTVIATIVTILIQCGSRAFADNYTWTGDNNDSEWCEPLNWENSSGTWLDGYPGKGNSTHDTAIVGFGSIGPCEDITLAKLTIEGSGRVNIIHKLNITGLLTIKRGGELYINAGEVELSANNRSHKIGGLIKLTSDSSTLLISGNASLDPYAPGSGAVLQYGTVKGLRNSACIAICNGKTLTNNITICGMMTIKSTTCGSTTASGKSDSAAKKAISKKLHTGNTAVKTIEKAAAKTIENTTEKTAVNVALKF